MAENKKSFVAYVDWGDTFNALPDDKAGQLVKFLFAYVNDEDPKTDDVLINAVFVNIKQQLKRDLKKWEHISTQRSDIGKLGGLKSGEARQTKSKQMKQLVQSRSKAKQNEHVTVTVTDNVIDNDKEKNIIPPPIFLIAKYCKDRNNGIDPNHFYDYYQTRGWKVGKDKMKDWQSAIRTWENRNKKPEPKLMMP